MFRLLSKHRTPYPRSFFGIIYISIYLASWIPQSLAELCSADGYLLYTFERNRSGQSNPVIDMITMARDNLSSSIFIGFVHLSILFLLAALTLNALRALAYSATLDLHNPLSWLRVSMESIDEVFISVGYSSRIGARCRVPACA